MIVSHKIEGCESCKPLVWGHIAAVVLSLFLVATSASITKVIASCNLNGRSAMKHGLMLAFSASFHDHHKLLTLGNANFCCGCFPLVTCCLVPSVSIVSNICRSSEESVLATFLA